MKHDMASELRAIADGRLMLNVRNGVTVSRSMLAMIADEIDAERAAHAETKRELADLKDEWEAEYETRLQYQTGLRAAEARLAEARKALEPFAEVAGDVWADDNGWTDAACQNDRICDWFGPSAFRAARRVREGRDHLQECMEDVLEQQALASTGAVKVKPLKWNTGSRVGSYYAKGLGIAYEIDTDHNCAVLAKGDGSSILKSAYSTPEQAKAAAQADYERRLLSALEPAAPEGQQPVESEPVTNHWPEAHKVADILAENKGFWRSCTGCHETNEGYETGRYPYSTMFGCHVGHGCSECGGLGVVWEYWSDSALEAMARDDGATTRPSEQAVTEAIKRFERIADIIERNLWRQDEKVEDAKQIASEGAAALKAAMEAGSRQALATSKGGER